MTKLSDAADLLAFLAEELIPHQATIGYMEHVDDIREADKPDCTWALDEEHGYWDTGWDTGCDEAFVFNDGIPSTNSMKFCPYCGGKLIEQE